MKIRLLTFLACTLTLHAQDTAPAQDKPAEPPSPALPLAQGKLEAQIDGKKETLDLADPATRARLKGKVIIVTEINGHHEVRVVDAKDAERLPMPFPWNEKLPARTGPVTFLGVGAIEVPAEVAAQLTLPQDTGLQIAVVLPESPAAKAGLQVSDVIQKFEDQILVTPRQLAVLIANHKEGDAVKLSVIRKGAPMEITATLGKRDVAHTVESPDRVGKVRRDVIKLWSNAEGDAELAKKLRDALYGEGTPGGVKILPEEREKALKESVLRWAAEKPKREVPASEDVDKRIRDALNKVPAEERGRFEELLIESGALPKKALPFKEK